MAKIIPSFFLCVRILFFGAALCHTGWCAEDQAQQIKELMQRFSSERLFSGVVLVAEAGEIIFEGVYGLADIGAKISVTPQMSFCIGSMSKQFAAMAAMQLVERGKLKLDDPVTKYLPDYPPATGDHITIHHLLSHTSGIPQDNPLTGAFAENEHRPNTRQEMLSYFQDSALLFAPGEGFQYSNFNYNLLVMIMEEVTGQTYPQLLREMILEPLHMNATGIAGIDTPDRQLAIGYEYQLLREPAAVRRSDPSTCMGAGDLFSNTHDLLLWDRALYTNVLLSDSLREILFTPYANGFGYGWQVGRYPVGDGSDSVAAIYHDGGVPGYQSIIIRIPEDRRLLVVLSNGNEPWIHTRLSRVRQDVAPAVLAALYNRPVTFPKRSAAYELAVADTIAGSPAINDGFARLVRDDPDDYAFDPEEFYCVGLSCAWDKRYNKAVEFLKIAVEELGVDNLADAWQCHNVYGESLFMLGMIEPGCAQFERSLELKPNNPFAVRALKAAEPYRKPGDR